MSVLPPKYDGTLYEEQELPESLDLADGQVVCVTYKKVIGTYQDKGKTHKSWGGAVRIYGSSQDG